MLSHTKARSHEKGLSQRRKEEEFLNSLPFPLRLGVFA